MSARSIGELMSGQQCGADAVAPNVIFTSQQIETRRKEGKDKREETHRYSTDCEIAPGIILVRAYASSSFARERELPCLLKKRREKEEERKGRHFVRHICFDFLRCANCFTTSLCRPLAHRYESHFISEDKDTRGNGAAILRAP